jgi:hypothetical protein
MDIQRLEWSEKVCLKNENKAKFVRTFGGSVVAYGSFSWLLLSCHR